MTLSAKAIELTEPTDQTRAVLILPGYFRPTKLWDLLVMDKGELIAAIELKSQVGPSFGNNFSNRTEEAIGTAHYFWTAYREDAFVGHDQPQELRHFARRPCGGSSGKAGMSQVR